jgi:hypothetical protein
MLLFGSNLTKIIFQGKHFNYFIVDVDFLKRAFNTRVEVDTCNYKLKFGIEKLDQEIDLFNYKWGM